ncbi:MAG: AarF/ABC1/UbiB kinase family protein, partial [Planctomycetaceae bacterium]|nr:AarF/ABC1/UbiB kinase family protein [Planctomycetaceae bacterium]
MPSITSLPQVVRNAARLHQVISVLARYGLAGWLHRIPLDWLQQHFRTSGGDRIAHLSRNQRIREALSELGTTFIKIGQILSTRPDIVGPELADELSSLQSGTAPDDWASVRALVESELECRLEDAFASFEETPIASASIGQVHRAVLPGGRTVAVKVQHIGIEEKIRNDLEIAIELARLVEAHSAEAALYRPVTTVEEISRALMRELDFGQELRNARSFAHHFRNEPEVHFPETIPDLSSRRVLTMEFLEGIELSRRELLQERSVDLNELAERGARVFLEMVFRDGFFHADPHPGNLLLLPDGAIGILDCGMVGRIDELVRDQFEDLLLAAVEGDSARMVETIEILGELPSDFDRQSLNQDVAQFFDHYATLDLTEFDLGEALNDAMSIIRRQHIRLPGRLAMLIRMIGVLEGTMERLSPAFRLVDLLKPYRASIIRRRMSPKRLQRRMLTAYRRWSRLLDIAPGNLADILEKVKQGRFDVHLDHRRLDGIVNRLVLGIIVAALFVGSSLLWSRNVPPQIYGYSLPGVLGCSLAV